MGLLTLGCSLEGEKANHIWIEAGLQATGSPLEGDTDFHEGGVKVPWNLPGDGAMPPAIWPCQQEK